MAIRSVEEVIQNSIRVEYWLHQIDRFDADSNRLPDLDLTPFVDRDRSAIRRDMCRVEDPLTADIELRIVDEQAIRLWGTTQPPWTAMRLRFSMRVWNLATGHDTGMWRLGTLIPESPSLMADQRPRSYAIGCHDIIYTLTSPTGGTLHIPGGVGVGDAIAGLFTDQFDIGSAPNRIPIDGRFLNRLTALVPGEGLNFMIKQEMTWLKVIDRLLDIAGWRPAWVNRDGFLTSEPWVNPTTLNKELTLDDTQGRSAIGLGATFKQDAFFATNRWHFTQSNVTPGETPSVENGGIVIVENEDDGPAAIKTRGYTRNAIYDIVVADNQSLQHYADRQIVADTIPVRQLCLKVKQMPFPWHRGIVEVTHKQLGIVAEKFFLRSWSLPMNGDDADIVLEAFEGSGELLSDTRNADAIPRG